MNVRLADAEDVDLIYNWTNDPVTRSQSYASDSIPYDDHVRWFNNKISNKEKNPILIFNHSNSEIGLVRFELKEDHWLIGIMIDPNQRGKGYASKMLEMACDYIKSQLLIPIYAYVKVNNQASSKAFLKAGFEFEREVEIKGHQSYLYLWK